MLLVLLAAPPPDTGMMAVLEFQNKLKAADREEIDQGYWRQGRARRAPR